MAPASSVTKTAAAIQGQRAKRVLPMTAIITPTVTAAIASALHFAAASMVEFDGSIILERTTSTIANKPAAAAKSWMAMNQSLLLQNLALTP